MPALDLFGARLLVVTGKGGTGKTSVATALGLAAASTGRRVLLAEVEGRQGIAHMLGIEPLSYEERPIPVPGSGTLSALAVDREAALREYLARYGAGSLATLLSWANLTHFITAAAPGLGDILLIGKVWEAASRQQGSRPQYDLVVLDAPPTGRLVPFLRAPETVTELARVGPIRHQAESVRDLLDDPKRTSVILVTLAEELPVTETIESAAALTSARLPVGQVVANRLLTEPDELRVSRLPALAKDPLPLVRAAGSAGLDLDERAALALVTEAKERHRQVLGQRRLLAELAEGLEVPVLQLPLLADEVRGFDAVGVLAEHLLAGLGASPAPDPVAAER